MHDTQKLTVHCKHNIMKLHIICHITQKSAKNLLCQNWTCRTRTHQTFKQQADHHSYMAKQFKRIQCRTSSSPLSWRQQSPCTFDPDCPVFAWSQDSGQLQAKSPGNCCNKSKVMLKQRSLMSVLWTMLGGGRVSDEEEERVLRSEWENTRSNTLIFIFLFFFQDLTTEQFWQQSVKESSDTVQFCAFTLWLWNNLFSLATCFNCNSYS